MALRSVGYAYGTPLPPYNIVFGMSFPLDIDAFRRPVIVTRTIEKSIGAPPPIEGRVAGVVKSSKGGAPVAGAIVAVAGRPRARVATDPDGIPSRARRCRRGRPTSRSARPVSNRRS